MNLQLAKGTYILAVSGGVDSMVLLDLASKIPESDYTFIVAHFDHGIRPDSHLDAELVRQQAGICGFEYVEGKGSLGEHASEDTARTARYVFLRLVEKQYNADYIVTAHHKDDLIETILLHLQRGTGRQGLTPMTNTKDILRPLLSYEKSSIIEYAEIYAVEFRQDSTNDELVYKRNVLRHTLAQPMAAPIKNDVYELYTSMLQVNQSIDQEIRALLQNILVTTDTIRRTVGVTLPYAVLQEVVIAWLKSNGINGYDKSLVNRLSIAIKTLPIGNKLDIGAKHWLVSERTSLKIVQK